MREKELLLDWGEKEEFKPPGGYSFFVHGDRDKFFELVEILPSLAHGGYATAKDLASWATQFLELAAKNYLLKKTHERDERLSSKKG